MREKVSAEAVERFMIALGHAGRSSARIYFVGGVSAVLLGWRETTIDIDLKLVPVLRALPDLKELYKYPALDTKTFHAAVQAFVQSVQQDEP
jgi:hypothetical protein